MHSDWRNSVKKIYFNVLHKLILNLNRLDSWFLRKIDSKKNICKFLSVELPDLNFEVSLYEITT